MNADFNWTITKFVDDCGDEKDAKMSRNCTELLGKLCEICFKIRQDAIPFPRCWSQLTTVPYERIKTPELETSSCVDWNTHNHLQLVNNLYIGGYAVSLVALVISLVIFFSFRALQCLRIRIHIQLFLSFVFSNTVWILNHVLLKHEEVYKENPLWCKLLTVLCKYTTLANHMWMFCEGLHLHLVMVVVFVNGDLSIKWFLCIGWGVSLIATIAYVIAHLLLPEEDGGCWLDDDKSSLAVTIPIVISLIVSLIFLINVLRIIMKITHPTTPNPTPLNIKRTLRAALILIPLLGLQVMLVPFRPSDATYQKYFDYLTLALVAPQGLCVSILFCFANHEVHQAVRTAFSRVKYACRFNDYLYTGQAESADVYTIRGNTVDTKQEELL